jgi:pimeloyl-ACP methyl ester carboxylesterase
MAAHYSIVIPERRWHGRTACVGTELTYELMASDTEAFMDALGIRNAHLIGQSDGADVAALVALQRPELVRKLVMIGGNFNTDYLTPAARTWLRGLTPAVAREVFPSVVDLYYKVVPDADVRFPILIEMLAKLYSSDWRIPTASLGRIAAPTLVISGDHDSIPLAHTLELFQSIPKAQLYVIPDADHESVRKKPELVNSAIMRFLQT